MKTIILIVLGLLMSLAVFATPDSTYSPMRPKLDAERMRLKEERKFARRNVTKPSIRFIHITLFISTSFFLWYESRDDWRKP